MHWILEDDTFHEGTLPRITEALKKIGDTYAVVKYVPFATLREEWERDHPLGPCPINKSERKQWRKKKAREKGFMKQS
jgi:hypothetical protein